MTVYNETASRYITDLFGVQDDGLLQTLQDIKTSGLPAITITPEEGRFMQVLVRAAGVRNAIEVGTLGGYSGTWIARGLAPGGRLITLEKDPIHAEVARRNFERNGVADRVEVRLGNAHTLLQQLSGEGPVDFMFIDAEKTGYNAYLEWAVEHLAVGGIVTAHNALRHGDVFDPNQTDEATLSIRTFNRRAAEDDRLLATIYPGGDGILMAVKVHD